MTKYLFIQILYVYVWHAFSFLGESKQNHNLMKNVIISAKNSSVARGFPTAIYWRTVTCPFGILDPSCRDIHALPSTAVLAKQSACIALYWTWNVVERTAYI